MAIESTPPYDMNGAGINKNEGDDVFYTSPIFAEGNRSSGFLKRILSASVSSFLSMSVYFPILASVAMVILYFSDATIFSPLLFHAMYYPVYVLVDGFLVASIIVFVLALLTSSLATAQGANAQGYNILKSGHNELIARLNVPGCCPFKVSSQQVKADFGLDRLERHHIAALREAYTSFSGVSESLSSLSSLQWVLGTGYPYTWGMIHRAQEALIEVEPIPMIIREAMRDRLDLLGSNIENRDGLLKELVLAVKDLDAEAGKYFGDTQSESFGAIQEKIQELYTLFRGISNKDTGANVSPEHTNDIPVVLHDPMTETRARAAMRQVKYVLNTFKESRLSELVQARNNLTSAILAGGLITYLMLCATMLLSDDPSPIHTGATFYIVGAVIGLFGRLYSESMASHATNDYGLSLRRLIAIPLLSGIAALGGVFLVATLPIAINTVGTSSTTVITVNKILSITPFNLLVAAIFGFAPNLLIRGLQQRADKVISDLESARSGRVDQEGRK